MSDFYTYQIEHSIDLSTCIGQKITALTFEYDTLSITFGSGLAVDIFDNHFEDPVNDCVTYMTCDDDLPPFVGSVFLGYELLDESFLTLRTSLGNITCEAHNENNGYYEGFEMVCVEADRD